jgi:hypothetical protein
MITCCKDCDKRYPGCHDYCETYLDEKEKHDKLREKIRKDKQGDIDYYDAWYSNRKKMRRMR